MQRSSVVLTLTIVLSVAFLAVGAVLIATSNAGAASFGWFAYQPLSSTAMLIGAPAMVGTTTLAGAILVALGLLGLGGAAGFLLGRRVRADR